jgi:hypothetical protein
MFVWLPRFSPSWPVCLEGTGGTEEKQVVFFQALYLKNYQIICPEFV